MFKMILTTLIITTCIQSVSYSQLVTLQVAKGQKFRVERSTVSSNNAEAMGQTMESMTNSSLLSWYEVLQAAPGETHLQTTLTKINFTANMMGQELSYDSEKKDQPGQMAEVFDKMLNNPKNIRIDRKGTITQQDKSATEEAGLPIPGFGESGISVETILFIPALLERELSAGMVIFDTSGVNKEKFQSRDTGSYTVSKIENSIAYIQYSGVQVIQSVSEQMGMEMNSTSNNKIKSELQLDLKTGVVVARKTITEAQVAVDAGGMLIPGNSKTESSVQIQLVQ